MDISSLLLQFFKRCLTAVFGYGGYKGRQKHRHGDSYRLIPLVIAKQKDHVDCQCRKQHLDDRISEIAEKLLKKTAFFLTCQPIAAVLLTGQQHLAFAQTRQTLFLHHHILLYGTILFTACTE